MNEPGHVRFDESAIRRAVSARRELFAGEGFPRTVVTRTSAQTRADVCAEVEVRGNSIIVDLPWPAPDIPIPLPIPVPDGELVRVCFDLIWEGWWPDGACITVYFRGDQVYSECLYF